MSKEITTLEIITQRSNYYTIDIDDEKIKIFTNLNANTGITISRNDEIQFSGVFARSINKFIYQNQDILIQ